MGCGGYDAGGIAKLARLVADYPDEVEFELLSRGYHLHDVEGGRITAHEAIILATTHPDSRVVAALRGEDAPWDTETMLLASIYDILSMQLWADHNRDESQRPEPLERPGFRPKTKSYGDIVAKNVLREAFGLPE